MEQLAPVALFVYNRPDNTERTLRALMDNTLAPKTEVIVFSDGGKDSASWAAVAKVRACVHRIAREVQRNGRLKSLTIVERPENYYLERNIIEGINSVFVHHDRIIVLEDDIVTAPHFLDYMNTAFTLYADVPRVMHIAGFTRLDLLGDHPELVHPHAEVYFTPHTAGWGWGTWRDRWQRHFIHYSSRRDALEGLSDNDIAHMEYDGAFPCLHSLDRTPIPWDVCWEIAVYRAGGLSLAPAHTLVRNIGLNQGTHFARSFALFQRFEYDRPVLTRRIRLPEPPLAPGTPAPLPDPRIEALFAEAIRDWGIRYTALGRCVRRLLHAYRHLLRRI